MSASTKIGLLLVGLGALALLLGTTKFKSKQEFFSVGGFEASGTKERAIPELRHAGAGLIVVGGLVLVVGWRTPRKK
jgi:hypothetical protein